MELNYSSRKRVIIFLVLIATILVFCSQLTTAYALPFVASDAESKQHMDEYEQKVMKFYRTAKAIAIPIAAVGFAASAFRLFFASESSAEAARKQMLLCFLAMGAIYMLPAFIKLGLSVGRAHGWTP